MHLTRVRSCKLDNWTQEDLSLMQLIGNGRANLYWEGKRQKGAGGKPTADSDASKRRTFLKEKYVKLTWADETVGNPVKLFEKAVSENKNPADYLKQHAANGASENSKQQQQTRQTAQESGQEVQAV